MAQIMVSLILNGWCDRALVVVQGRKFRGYDYLALTGSHRIHAARRLKMKRIPAIVIEWQEIPRRIQRQILKNRFLPAYQCKDLPCAKLLAQDLKSPRQKIQMVRDKD